MDWVKEAKEQFRSPKPEHFTKYMHCCECFEHDETLRNSDIDAIGLAELGNAGWDPICFCSVEGKKYYMPALIRLSMETMDDEFYLGQLLFHLESDGQNNNFFLSCSPQQREFIASFVEHVIEAYPDQLERCSCTDNALRVYEIWSEIISPK